MTAAVAHRGDSSLYRENTLAAIRSAVDAGADTIEIDVRLTRDGEVVLLHDATLSRLWGIDANVADLTLGEIEQIGAGEMRIPRLEQVLQFMAATSALLLIDMDSAEPAEAAQRVVAGACSAPRSAPGSTARVAWCGDVAAMRVIRDLDLNAEIWMPWAEPTAPSAAQLTELRPTFVNLNHLVVGHELVAGIHSLGARVSCWTVDEAVQITWLVSIGVDSITSNRLSTLLNITKDHRFSGAENEVPSDAAADGVAVAVRERARLIARELAEWAVDYVLAHRVTRVSTKSNPADHVTEIDLAIERGVRSVIGAQFPGHDFVGEEFGGSAHSGGPCWYLDPVDGTANLANGMPWTSFSLALVVDGAPVVGVVADPWRGVIVEAAEGRGAWQGGTRLTLGGAVRVVDPADPRHSVDPEPVADPLRGAMVSTELAGHSAWPGMLPMLEALSARYCTMRIMGSGTLTLAGVALGHGIGAVIGRFGAVDHLAALLIVREAGGVVLDENGDNTVFPTSGGVLVAATRAAADELFTLWNKAASPQSIRDAALSLSK